MRKIFSLAAIALISAPAFSAPMAVDPQSAAVMSNFSYDYVEARIGVSPATYGGAISKSVHPNAHVIASFDSELNNDYDASAGLAFHAPINNWADFTGEMKLRFLDYKDTNDSDTGVELNLGVRQWLGPQLEVGGKVGFITINDADDWVGNIYTRFHSTELFSVAVEANFNGYDKMDSDQVLMSVRFKY